ncbi:putative cytosine deaminase [Xylariaceae sp. FL0804]|nr:putative cytosine deaminase [Xylariaceae sp. FL0804]
MNDARGLALALEEAQIGYSEGGVPIGAALVAADGTLLGRGRNMRVQKEDPILHGETSCLQNAGRLPSSAYKGSTMYTTLSPCDMCTNTPRPWPPSAKTKARVYLGTGACILYGVRRVVIGENRTFLGGEAYLRQRGVEVVVLDSADCRKLMEKFIAEKPDVWNEDIGVEERVHSKEDRIR